MSNSENATRNKVESAKATKKEWTKPELEVHPVRETRNGPGGSSLDSNKVLTS